MRRETKAPKRRPAGGVVLVAAACLTAACTAAEAPQDVLVEASGRLFERVQEALEARDAELRAHVSHEALLREVPAAELEQRLGHVRVVRGEAGPWLGNGGVEPYGGGVLALLLHAWRPEGRRARLDDAFPFANGRLALGALYEGHRRQVFLPDAKDRLPRMRFVVAAGPGGVRTVERDAFHFLDVLIAHEPDPSATWVNALDQRLRVDRLMGRVLEVHRTPPASAPDADLDHGRLHLVALLLAWHDRRVAAGRPPPFDPEAVQRRYLVEGACAGPEAAAVDRAAAGESWGREVECLAHRVESLGRLMVHPAIDWSAEEIASVVAFLDALDGGALRDPADVHVAHLVHFALGLDRLRAGPSR